MRAIESDPLDVTLSRHINASRRRVFDAFTDPDLLSKWFTTSAEADLTVGGRYRNADNDEGEFLVLDRSSRVHFTWENANHCPGTIVEVEFEQATNDSTTVALWHRGIETQEGSDDMRQGWSWALDSLKSFLERGAPIPHSEWVPEQSRDTKPSDGG